jgi:hypothetical protein
LSISTSAVINPCSASPRATATAWRSAFTSAVISSRSPPGGAKKYRLASCSASITKAVQRIAAQEADLALWVIFVDDLEVDVRRVTAQGLGWIHAEQVGDPAADIHQPCAAVHAMVSCDLAPLSESASGQEHRPQQTTAALHERLELLETVQANMRHWR